jgi:LysM repeat protein
VRKALARIFAIVAIAGCAVAIYSVVNSNLLKDDDSPKVTTTSKKLTTKSHGKHTPYVVKAGDTLSQIAEDHHVTVTQIKKLNKNLVASRLHAGQHIQLR